MVVTQNKPKTFAAWLAAVGLSLALGGFPQCRADEKDKKPADEKAMDKDIKWEKATLGGGCFWCVEHVLQQIDGIRSVRSGYMGGTTSNPTYEEVCEKKSGHIEVVEVTYDPAKISYDLILEAFWIIHDPTSKDKQGHDKGIQYRSIIFYHNDEQKKAAEASIAKQNQSGKYSSQLVTELRPASTFWEAEEYHQDFFARNPEHSYCNYWIPGKVEKLFKDAQFKEKKKQAEGKN